jgi:hypothetical protein
MLYGLRRSGGVGTDPRPECRMEGSQPLVELLDVHALAPGRRQRLKIKDCEISRSVRIHSRNSWCGPQKFRPNSVSLAKIEVGFTTVQSLGAAIDKDVRDAINAGAIPGPRLLTSIHQITERILWNQSSGESRARANQGAGGGGRSALATMGSVTDWWSAGRFQGTAFYREQSSKHGFE